MKSFLTRLTVELISNMFNDYQSDNYDYYRFGEAGIHQKNDPSLKDVFKNFLKKKGYFYVHDVLTETSKKFVQFDEHISKFQSLYDLLEDESSKNLLIKVIAYHILGYKKLKLPLNTPFFWNKIDEIETKYTDKTDYIPIKFGNWKLWKIDLLPLGFPIKVYHRPSGIFCHFVIKHYQYADLIKVVPGDVVIDAGSCYGETALHFAFQAGAEGRVFSFDFEPNNIEIFYRNLHLNPELEQRIFLEQHPLWQESGKKLSFISNGPGSWLEEKPTEIEHIVTTICIDDFVERMQFQKVDFIKMDIEGAELYALKGAIKTLKRFTPKLAISLYHRVDDFKEIPEFLKSLGINYKFYFGHFTIHAEESVLFCSVN